MASHELRTPLTAISGFVQVARRRLQRAATNGDATVDWQKEAQRAAETLELAARQSRRLARLVDELLDVSRLQLGRAELHQSQIDVVATLRDAIDPLRITKRGSRRKRDPRADRVGDATVRSGDARSDPSPCPRPSPRSCRRHRHRPRRRRRRRRRHPEARPPRRLRTASPGIDLVLITGSADRLPDAVLSVGMKLVRKPFELGEVLATLKNRT
jgi:signal transduction histidine kinase